MRPFGDRPWYAIDIDGGHDWDYADPCSKSWNAENVYNVRIKTILDRRPDQYSALLSKVSHVCNVLFSFILFTKPYINKEYVLDC